MTARLRELIRQVRACQTAAEERAVIQKECALIRTDFKENKESRRARNIMKLMYIHMLGYATEFGQMECVKLLAQSEYAHKRVGYLTLGILLDENGEVLTLIQNHLKRDLTNGNQFIQALALATVANICSEDMARDVCQEVAGLVDSPNSYVRKKAILAGLRIVRKVPEFVEHFSDRVSNALTDRNHGVMVSALNFAAETIPWPSSRPYVDAYTRILPQMGKVLKSLVMSSYAAENDVNGVADPFVQVKMLRVLGHLAGTSASVCQSINDILAQVATNTDNSKNAGCAILYECAMVIVSTDSDPGLRPLGVNILARFLSNKDNNYRYVALNSMLKLVSRDPDAVQKHRATIVECLKDPDPSIRKRALDLVVGLVQPANARVLVPDLTVYLGVCTTEFRDDLAEKLCGVIQRCAPNEDFQVDALLKVILTAGNHVNEPITHQFIALVSQTEKSIRQKAIERLWVEVQQPLDVHALAKRSLMISAAWLFGEFADELAELHSSDSQFYDAIVAKLAEMANLSKNNSVREFCLTAMMKLASRYVQCRFLATQAMEPYSNSADLEIQQRACEFLGILKNHEDIAVKTMAKMPPLEYTPPPVMDLSTAAASVPVSQVGSTAGGAPSAVPTAPQPTKKDVLDDIFGSVLTEAPQQQNSINVSAYATPLKTQQRVDHDSIFGTGFGGPGPQPTGMPVPQPISQQPPYSYTQPPAPVPPPAPVVPQGPRRQTIEGFRNDDVIVTFNAFRHFGTTKVEADVVIQPTRSQISELTVLIAVPKTASIDLLPLSSTNADPSNPVTQRIVVDTNTSGDGELKPLTLKVKIGFNIAGQDVNHVFQVKHLVQ